jgi:hypothetical protein
MELRTEHPVCQTGMEQKIVFPSAKNMNLPVIIFFWPSFFQTFCKKVFQIYFFAIRELYQYSSEGCPHYEKQSTHFQRIPWIFFKKKYFFFHISCL